MVDDDDITLTRLLANAFQDQIVTTRTGFDRLETAVIQAAHSAQRDMRVIAILLLFGLLASIGINVIGKWGDAEISLTNRPESTISAATAQDP